MTPAIDGTLRKFARTAIATAQRQFRPPPSLFFLPPTMNIPSRLSIASLLAATLAVTAACRAPSDTPTAPAPAPAPAAAGVPAETAAPPLTAQAPTANYLHVTPATLDKCKPGSEVEVTWDLAGDFPGVTGIQIFVGTDEAPKLFSSGGARGSTRTGAWTKPGSIFRLVNKKTGEEIERVVIGGPDC